MSRDFNFSEVTWNHAAKNDKWTQLDPDTKYVNDTGDTVKYPGGGDHFLPHSAIAPLADDLHPWENYNITSIIQEYIKKPNQFYGLWIKPYLTNTGRWYASSDYYIPDKRPKVIIKYSGTGIISKQAFPDKTNSITFFNAQNSVRLYIPISGKYTGTVFDLRGRVLYSFDGIGKKWSDIQKDNLENGLNILKVTSKDLTIIKKFMAY